MRDFLSGAPMGELLWGGSGTAPRGVKARTRVLVETNDSHQFSKEAMTSMRFHVFPKTSQGSIKHNEIHAFPSKSVNFMISECFQLFSCNFHAFQNFSMNSDEFL